MVEAAIPSEQAATRGRSVGHAGWVRICHWTIVLAFSVLAFSGYFILMTHPRLYWGEVGNDLTPALLEFPISDNHRPDKWVETTRFGDSETPLVSANRTYEIYNQNSWGRSLHFLAAWVFVAGLMVYVAAALATGHAWRNLISGLTNVLSARLLDDLKQHLRRDRAHATGPPEAGGASSPPLVARGLRPKLGAAEAAPSEMDFG